MDVINGRKSIKPRPSGYDDLCWHSALFVLLTSQGLPIDAGRCQKLTYKRRKTLAQNDVLMFYGENNVIASESARDTQIFPQGANLIADLRRFTFCTVPEIRYSGIFVVG